MSKLGVTDAETIKETSAKMAKHIMNILHEIAQQRTFLHNYMYEITYLYNYYEIHLCINAHMRIIFSVYI